MGLREFGSDCRIFSVHWKGRVVAAVWTLFYKDEVLPYYGGSVREYNRLGVNNFMYWMLMKYGMENGYRIFDFGRSKKGTGSFSFKKRWGFTMTDLHYQYDLVGQQVLPDTSPLNPRFSLAIRVWRRLPLFITNSLGPLVSKHLLNAMTQGVGSQSGFATRPRGGAPVMGASTSGKATARDRAVGFLPAAGQ